MTVQLSTAVRNARLDSIETTISTSAILKIRTGAQPANCAAADSGTVLATCNLPADYMAAAAGGLKRRAEPGKTYLQIIQEQLRILDYMPVMVRPVIYKVRLQLLAGVAI